MELQPGPEGEDSKRLLLSILSSLILFGGAPTRAREREKNGIIFFWLLWLQPGQVEKVIFALALVEAASTRAREESKKS